MNVVNSSMSEYESKVVNLAERIIKLGLDDAELNSNRLKNVCVDAKPIRLLPTLSELAVSKPGLLDLLAADDTIARIRKQQNIAPYFKANGYTLRDLREYVSKSGSPISKSRLVGECSDDDAGIPLHRELEVPVVKVRFKKPGLIEVVALVRNKDWNSRSSANILLAASFKGEVASSLTVGDITFIASNPKNNTSTYHTLELSLLSQDYYTIEELSMIKSMVLEIIFISTC